MDSTLTEILTKMCSYVQCNFDDIDFKKDSWFAEYEWTEQQEEDFRHWLSKKMYDDRKARLKLMRFPSKSKKLCDKFADDFVFQYGWKRKNG